MVLHQMYNTFADNRQTHWHVILFQDGLHVAPMPSQHQYRQWVVFVHIEDASNTRVRILKAFCAYDSSSSLIASLQFHEPIEELMKQGHQMLVRHCRDLEICIFGIDVRYVVA